jgi:hypothetical protein
LDALGPGIRIRTAAHGQAVPLRSCCDGVFHRKGPGLFGMGGQQSNLLGNQLEVCCYARTDNAKSASEEFSPWTSKNTPAFTPNGPPSRSSPPVIVERRGSTTTKVPRRSTLDRFNAHGYLTDCRPFQGIRHATNSGTRVGVSIPNGGAHPRKVETPRSTVSSNSTPSSYQDAARKMWEEDAKFEHCTT